MTRTVADLRYACQTYSWQMSLDRYRGRVDHMAGQAAAAGFTGFEPELIMLGDGWTADGLQRTLRRAGVELAALVLVEPWRHRTETAREREDADLVIDTVASFSAAKIVLCPLPGDDRRDLTERQHHAIACMSAVADRAADRGIRCTFHPNSPPGSVFRTASDYELMRDLLPATIGYAPDVGHIAKGGMDPLTVIRQWRDRIDHVHIKDLDSDGRWAETGAGTVDVPAVLEYLAATDYPGWVTFEDESPAAEADPDRATRRNGAYVADLRSVAARA